MNLFENFNSWYKLNENILIESRKNYGHVASQILKDSGLFNDEIADDIINEFHMGKRLPNGEEVSPYITAYTHADKWLNAYLPQIARWLVDYCKTGNLQQKYNEFTDLQNGPVKYINEYLIHIKKIRPNQNDKQKQKTLDDYNQMSLENLKNRIREINTEAKKHSDEISSKIKTGNSNYKLIPITSYEQFYELFGGNKTGNGKIGAWCTANSKQTYTQYKTISNGVFFVLAKNGWENIKFDPESNKQNPKDEYGTSLIALVINKRTKEIEYATLRCNHFGTADNADHQYGKYDYWALKDLTKLDVENEINKFLEEHSEEIQADFGEDSNFDHDDLIAYIRQLDGEDDNIIILLPDYITTIDEGAFFRSAVDYIELPNSIISIGEQAFADSGLEEIILPDSINFIGAGAFIRCKLLDRINENDTLPAALRRIEDKTFSNCLALHKICIPKNVESIGFAAFANSGLQRIYFTNLNVELDDEIFNGCNELDTIYIETADLEDALEFIDRLLDSLPIKTAMIDVVSNLTGEVFCTVQNGEIIME